MPEDIAISIDHVSKKYCKRLRRAMQYGLQDLSTELIGWPRPGTDLRPDEFWALRDLSLQIRKGEWLGVVGPNGAGKSTLLKVLSGTLPPNAGRIAVNGRLTALIELGAGFHPMFTGRENIYMQAAVMGIPRRDVDSRFDDIVAFADIGDFLDSPVKYYSSGMHARLGFAIAVHFDPAILLVDEVLAVGDLAFQEKCMRTMQDMRAKQTAVLLVQQHTYWIEALCDNAVWLDGGRCVMTGKARDVVRAYMDDTDARLQNSLTPAADPAAAPATPMTIEKVELVGNSGDAQSAFQHGESMLVRIHYHAHQPIHEPLFNIRVFSRRQDVFEASMLIDGPVIQSVEGRGIVECRLETLPLTPRVYEVVLFARTLRGMTDIIPMRTYAVFRIEDAGTLWDDKAPMALNHLRNGSPVYVPHSWRFLDAVDGPRSSSNAADVAVKC